MKRAWHISFLIIGLLFIAGCGDDPPANQAALDAVDAPPLEDVVEEEQEEITEDTVIDATPDQLAYLHCIREGHDVNLQFSTEQNRYTLYCDLIDGTRCDARQFVDGICGEEDKDIIVQTPIDRTTVGLAQGPRFCEPIAKPVCGADGRTYTNSCYAEQHRVAIVAEGACTELSNIDLPNVEADRTRTGTNVDSDGIRRRTGIRPRDRDISIVDGAPGSERPGETTLPDPETLETTEGLPDWVSLPIALLRASETIPRATIEQCRIGGIEYVLQVEGNNDDFAILYDRAGNVVCYPTNDLNGACPAFDFDGRSCTVVWDK